MPTGYTEGVVNGNIDTVERFAKVCMRAFGATMHMRDESLDAKYIPRKPETYYLAQIKETKKDLEKFRKLTVKGIEKEIIKEAKKDVAHYKAEIARCLVIKGRLERLIEQVNKLKLPKTHMALKVYMLDQLNSTIQWDTGTDFYEEKLKSATEALNNPIDAKKYRKNIIVMYTDRIKRLNESYKKDLKQCDVTNKWVSTLLKILDKSH
jgi:hypothetical protein